MRLAAHAAEVDVLDDEGGAAYVEFLMSFIPLFFLFMGMVQMSLMYAADLVVQHAASNAARAAAVVLDDDPERYEGQDRRSVEGDGSGRSTEDILGGIAGIFGGSASGSGGGGGEAPGGERMGAIRAAAAAPLMAVSPSLSQLTGDESVNQAIGVGPERGAGSIAYNRSAMGVTFPTSPGGTEYRTTFPTGDDVQVTTRVTYLFHCAVPLANRLMCETYASLRLGPAAAAAEGILSDMADGSISFEEAMNRLERVNVSRQRHERDEPAIRELESAGANDLMYFTGARSARFKVLRGEATMPLQYARYRYQSE